MIYNEFHDIGQGRKPGSVSVFFLVLSRYVYGVYLQMFVSTVQPVNEVNEHMCYVLLIART